MISGAMDIMPAPHVQVFPKTHVKDSTSEKRTSCPSGAPFSSPTSPIPWFTDPPSHLQPYIRKPCQVEAGSRPHTPNNSDSPRGLFFSKSNNPPPPFTFPPYHSLKCFPSKTRPVQIEHSRIQNFPLPVTPSSPNPFFSSIPFPETFTTSKDDSPLLKLSPCSLESAPQNQRQSTHQTGSMQFPDPPSDLSYIL